MIARILSLSLSAIALSLAAAGPADAARPTLDRKIAVLQGLDKVTARVSKIEVPVGEGFGFGTLRITVRACRSTRPEETPENAAFLEIQDLPPGGSPESVFSGWMFASSPAVSALEHPVYDIWVIECADALSPPEGEDEAVSRGDYSLPDNPPPPPRRPETP
jgi:hypothetical protein